MTLKRLPFSICSQAKRSAQSGAAASGEKSCSDWEAEHDESDRKLDINTTYARALLYMTALVRISFPREEINGFFTSGSLLWEVQSPFIFSIGK